MIFYEKLRYLRKRSGLSQEELAARLDVSRQAVSKWESGQGYPETEKLLRLSSLFGVSLDYLLKDEAEGEEGNPASASPEEGEPGLYVSREMAQGYLTEKRRGAQRIALGVAVLILAVALFMLFEQWESLGMLLLFSAAAVGVVLLVWQGFQPKQYEQIEQQTLFFDPVVLEQLRAEANQGRRRSGSMVVLGLALCIMSFGIMFFLNQYMGMPEGFSTALCFLMIALGVSLFILAGSSMAAYDILIQNRKHRKEADAESRHGWVFGLVMPLAAFVYVGLGLAFHVWHIAWIIFPVAAICCSAYVSYRDSRDR